MIKFEFDVHKIIQIVNYLLKKNGDRLNYTKLLKLLYIADKEFFKKWDFSISQDSYVSLKNGPILSKTYDLIKREYADIPEQIQWDCLFFTDGYDLVLLQNNNLTTGLLSDAERQTLDEVNSKFKRKTWQEMIDYTHNEDLFPEVKWREAEQMQTSIDLNVEDILQSLKRTPEEIAVIDKEISLQQKEAKILFS